MYCCLLIPDSTQKLFISVNSQMTKSKIRLKHWNKVRIQVYKIWIFTLFQCFHISGWPTDCWYVFKLLLWFEEKSSSNSHYLLLTHPIEEAMKTKIIQLLAFVFESQILKNQNVLFCCLPLWYTLTNQHLAFYFPFHFWTITLWTLLTKTVFTDFYASEKDQQ